MPGDPLQNLRVCQALGPWPAPAAPTVVEKKVAALFVSPWRASFLEGLRLVFNGIPPWLSWALSPCDLIASSSVFSHAHLQIKLFLLSSPWSQVIFNTFNINNILTV